MRLTLRHLLHARTLRIAIVLAAAIGFAVGGARGPEVRPLALAVLCTFFSSDLLPDLGGSRREAPQAAFLLLGSAMAAVGLVLVWAYP